MRFPFGITAMGIGAVCGTGAELLLRRGTFLLGFAIGASITCFAGAVLQPARRGKLAAAGVGFAMVGAWMVAVALRLFR